MKQSNYDKNFKRYSENINLSFIKLVSENSTVLEVGCNCGVNGSYLIKERNCKVYGLDISKKAILEAKKRLTKAEFMDISKDKFPFKKKFDVILFGDVLEHVNWPEEVLKNFKKYLVQDGLIIASIPNVANFRIRYSLFFGNWNYQEKGILDYTHFRFFTKKTIKELFYNSGLKIIEIKPTPIHLTMFKKPADLLLRLFPNFFGSQFIIIAKPNE